jgi:hypothetical protein
MSCTPVERSRKAYSRVLQAMQEPGTARNLAHVLAVSEATISRTKTETLEDAITLLYHLGFKVVEQDRECVPRDYLNALQTLARMQAQQPAQLTWDDA